MLQFAAGLRSTGKLRVALTDQQTADIIWSMHAADYRSGPTPTSSPCLTRGPHYSRHSPASPAHADRLRSAPADRCDSCSAAGALSTGGRGRSLGGML